MKKMGLKVFALFMGVFLLFGMVDITGYAEGSESQCPYEEGTVECAIYKAMINMEETIDVSSYKLEFEEFYNISEKLSLSNPELFHVSYGYVDEYDDEEDYIKNIVIEYNLNEEEYGVYFAKMEEVAEKALSGLENTMSDVEKLLYLHDYILRNCEYGEKTHGWDAYGCLVEKASVSYGMSLAYKYLVEKAGFECEVVIGNSHSWNAVLLNGEYYFVDLCFDNLPSGSERKSSFDSVKHNHFLLTGDEIRDSGTYYHEDWETDINPTDTTYSEAWYKKVSCPFGYYEGEWYYWMNTGSNQTGPVIAKTDTLENPGTVLYDLSDFAWKFSRDSEQVWKGYQGNIGVCTERGELYFCSPTQIYRMDLKDLSAEPEVVYTVDLKDGFLYGLKVEGDELIYGVSTSPHIKEELYTLDLAKILDSYVAGDVSGDEELDANDALAILKKIARLPGDGFVERAADCNEDGVIDANDALWILKIVAKMDMGQIK